jgi:hypothetical protein
MSQKQVISASRRTDIPAFYLDWFISKVHQHYVRVKNPFNHSQIRTISLHPDHVAWIVFWSRNYSNLLKHHKEFSSYQLLFHFTIVPPGIFDYKTPLINETINQAGRIADLFGPDRIIWRYDPLIFWSEGHKEKSNHSKQIFIKLCRELSEIGITRCITSLVYPYAKFLNRIKKFHFDVRLIDPERSRIKPILEDMVDITSSFQMNLQACCSRLLTQWSNIEEASCIDGKFLNQLSGKRVVSEAKNPSREHCRCTRSIDVGDYEMHPCYFGCHYCYANPVCSK